MACDCGDRLDRIEALLLQLLGEPAVEPVEHADHAEHEHEHEVLLEPCILAHRLGLSDGHIRRLCSHGWRTGTPGVEKVGGRWRASIAAIEDLRRG